MYNMKGLEAIWAEHKKSLPFLYLSHDNNECDEPLGAVSQYVTAPVMFSFVWWILFDAINRNIGRIFFLARDGVILCRIAQLFCEQFKLDLECRCLYVSRASLRLPTYHFINSEAYDLLFLGGYNVTPFSLLQRLGFSQQEREKIYASCSIGDMPENTKLSYQQITQIRSELEQNKIYNNRMMELSIEAYPSTVGYLRQEGLMRGENFAVVDSGWTGTVQRSLRQLIENECCTASITGYYFGMYAPPRDKCDGLYLTWYFDSNSHCCRKMLFCNNLLECMLSEPCGMTVGYRQQNNTFIPIYGNAPDSKTVAAISLQQNKILSFTQMALKRIRFDSFDYEKLLHFSEDVLIRLMAFPTEEQALAYRDFSFSDDVVDNANLALISETQMESLKGYSLIGRVMRRASGRPAPYTEMFWAAGTAALLPAFKRCWYRLNIFAWEWAKYGRK